MGKATSSGLWLLLYTDGIVEARDAVGRRFGRERFADFVVRHHCGRLDDDATVLPAEWRAGHQHRLVP
ncbi:SpoIIE family protein phosphatase [Streptomyces canus]|uniref:SpoIIE family protein phosphatase n=1 Tax=Streptomyces canus TaxID=58343 RepID=UPI00369862DA